MTTNVLLISPAWIQLIPPIVTLQDRRVTRNEQITPGPRDSHVAMILHAEEPDAPAIFSANAGDENISLSPGPGTSRP